MKKMSLMFVVLLTACSRSPDQPADNTEPNEFTPGNGPVSIIRDIQVRPMGGGKMAFGAVRNDSPKAMKAVTLAIVGYRATGDSLGPTLVTMSLDSGAIWDLEIPIDKASVTAKITSIQVKW